MSVPFAVPVGWSFNASGPYRIGDPKPWSEVRDRIKRTPDVKIGDAWVPVPDGFTGVPPSCVLVPVRGIGWLEAVLMVGPADVLASIPESGALVHA